MHIHVVHSINLTMVVLVLWTVKHVCTTEKIRRPSIFVTQQISALVKATTYLAQFSLVFLTKPQYIFELKSVYLLHTKLYLVPTYIFLVLDTFSFLSFQLTCI